VGGLVGYVLDASTIKQSYATGDVIGSTYLGGLIGYIKDSGIILNSYATGTVTGGDRVGGLAGMLYDSATILNSYATGDVIGASFVGGLVGYLRYSTALNSYATGDITGTSYVSGIAGYAPGCTMSNLYWFNRSSDDAKACYYMGENTGCTAVSSESYFFTYSNAPESSWNFTHIWDDSDEGVDYPTLQLLAPEPPVLECPNGMAGSGTIGDPCQMEDASDFNSSRLCLACSYILNSDLTLISHRITQEKDGIQ